MKPTGRESNNDVVIMTSHTLVAQLTEALKSRIAELTAQGHQPGLAVILVGHDPKSELYVSSIKQRQAEDLGISFTIHRFDELVNEATILETIERLNSELMVSGIIIQLPLPEQLDTNHLLNAIAEEKDVDGLRSGSPFLPPTVEAIMKLLEAYDIPLADKKIVIVGKGRLVGGPLYNELKALKLNVTACDQSIDDLSTCTLGADILISATGVPRLIKPAMIQDGAVIIDVDTDVMYDDIIDKVSYITPQKGGVGPLTVSILLSHVVEAAGRVGKPEQAIAQKELDEPPESD